MGKVKFTDSSKNCLSCIHLDGGYCHVLFLPLSTLVTIAETFGSAIAVIKGENDSILNCRSWEAKNE